MGEKKKTQLHSPAQVAVLHRLGMSLIVDIVEGEYNMEKAEHIASSVLNTLKYLGLEGKIAEDVKKLALLAQHYESMQESWQVATVMKEAAVYGGVGNLILGHVCTVYKRTLAINVCELSKAIEKSLDFPIDERIIKFDWDS